MKHAITPGALLAAGCGGNAAKQDAGPPKDSTSDGGDPDAQCQPLPALPTCASPVAGTNVRLRRIGTTEVFPGDQAPLLVTAPVNDPRLFVVIREGTIQILEDEVRRPEPFIDLSDVLTSGGEQGLLDRQTVTQCREPSRRLIRIGTCELTRSGAFREQAVDHLDLVVGQLGHHLAQRR